MKKTDRFIVITSIFPPTKAIAGFSQQKDWQLIVVGDRKTPADWHYEQTKFLSVSDQESCGYHVAALLPWNHYCRKMVGYVHAIKSGAEVIVDTDDDNIANANWHVPGFSGEHALTKSGQGFVNIYKNFTSKHIWPRGFPLRRITDDKTIVRNEDLTVTQVEVGIWQGLADGDPDVDAIYRLTSNEPCRFEEREPIVLAEGTLCPFNSQNTAFRKELFPLLYLPAFVTFRFTDILRGLVAQPLMQHMGYSLGFTGATVFQERNPHDYLKDFESEIPCYLYSEKIIDAVNGSIMANTSLPNNLYNAYEALHKDGIVTSEELQVLSAWLKDLE